MSERDRGPDEGLANQMMRLNRSASTDINDTQQYHHSKYHPHHHHHQAPKQPYGYSGMPPAYPRHQRPLPHGYSQHHSFNTPQPRAHGRNGIQSVVTTSFSIDDEREDASVPRGYYHRSHHVPHHDDRHPAEGSRSLEDNNPRETDQSFREAPPPPMFDARAPMEAKAAVPIRIPPSPNDGRGGIMQPPEGSSPITGSLSSKVTPDGLKRSFWHHSRPTDTTNGSSLHPAFLPPKRTKLAPARKSRDVVLTPRTPAEAAAAEYGRSNSWAGPADDEHAHRHYRHTHSFPAPPWQQQQGLPVSPPHAHGMRPSGSFGGYHDEHKQEHLYGRSWSTDESAMGNRGAFRNVQGSAGRMPPHAPYGTIAHQGSFPPTAPHHRSSWGHAESYDWSSPPPQNDWQRDDVDSRRTYSRDMGSWDDRERQVSFDPYRYYDAHASKVTPMSGADASPHRSILKHGDSGDDMMQSQASRDGPLLLLAQPEDRISLSETLCTIRENIEVFRATKADVEAPAPGRKHPVIVSQVGLRCIHCRHTTKSSDRVKRAVCYPSSIKRIYRTVIDMKLDHFAHCRFVPKALKERLDELKAINTRSTGTTMQYFVRAAHKMGMADGPSGVRLIDASKEEVDSAPASSDKPEPSTGTKETPLPPSPSAAPRSSPPGSETSQIGSPKACNSSDSSEASPLAAKQLVRTDSNGSDASMTASDNSVAEVPAETFMGKSTLALPEDKMALSPLRCFLRENVFAFTATEEDIAVRTPTTFSVVVGQVGIGCVHCHSLPAKERSNRAVCFPFAINRIYQSVADIQRFHMGECKMVPPEVRDKFQSLQSASSKGSKGLATRQYWVTSAKKIGLIDTEKGIRYGRDPAVPATQAVSLDILAQVASNVTTVDRPLVLPEDKPYIAEFLYCVMEQLQPCRFTEADRNKRRLKDVGCIGVECKHCAGQVESRKFFWSSVNAVESNFVSVHTHMMECKNIPKELKEKLSELKLLRKEQTGRLKTGSQKSFFQRVWKRLHGDAMDQEQQQRQEQGDDDMAVETSPKKGTDSPSHVEKVSADIEKMAVISV